MKKNKEKLIRVTTVPISLSKLLEGQLKFMSSYYSVIGISGNGTNNELAKVSETEGVQVIPLEMTRKITPIKDLQALFKLYKIFKQEKPRIVHSHTPKAGTLSMIAAKMAGVPHRLHTIAGLPLLEASGIKRKILDFVEVITYKCATKIYPNSNGLKSIILENKYTKNEKLKVIGKGSSNGIDTSFFNPELIPDTKITTLKKEFGIKDDDFVFLFVGRLVKDKGVNELIKSFKNIVSSHKNSKLLLVGPYEKELDPLLAETIDSIENDSNVIHAGWQNDVRPFFSIADVFVFPSYREGFPNVVMQAGAMGLPCIVTDINGSNEIIENGTNGVIIPTKDTEELTKNMSLLYNDRSKLKELSKNTRKVIRERYERTFIWQELLKEYKEL